MFELIILGIFMIIAFLLGAYVGQKVSKGKSIEVNPIKAIEEYKEERKIKRQTKAELSKFDKMLENIDNYDGTGIGQKDL